MTDGSAVETTRHCRGSRPRALAPSWDLISAWLHHALGGARRDGHGR